MSNKNAHEGAVLYSSRPRRKNVTLLIAHVGDYVKTLDVSLMKSRSLLRFHLVGPRFFL